METYLTSEAGFSQFRWDDSFDATPEDHREDAAAAGVPHLRSVRFVVADRWDGAEIAYAPTWEAAFNAAWEAAGAYADSQGYTEADPCGDSRDDCIKSFFDGLCAQMWTAWSATPKPEPRRRFRLF
jgi:hypothetical protein